MKKTQIYKILWDYFNDYQVWKIIEKYTGLSKNQLFFCDEIDFKTEYLDLIIKKAKQKIPYEYIINIWEFFGLEFYVDSRVLIPRNDTEIMVGKAIEEINASDKIEYIDVWTGSSCVAVSILKNTPQEKIIKSSVIDISTEALEVSKINIEKHKIKNIEIIEWNLLNNYKNSKNKKIITANLPYIKNNDFENMSYETITHEPDLALYWWENTGFELYEKLITQCENLWNISLFIEIWFDQKEYAEKYLESKNLGYKIFQDNSWIDRCVKIYFI